MQSAGGFLGNLERLGLGAAAIRVTSVRAGKSSLLLAIEWRTVLVRNEEHIKAAHAVDVCCPATAVVLTHGQTRTGCEPAQNFKLEAQ